MRWRWVDSVYPRNYPAVNIPVSVPKTLDSMSTKNYTSGKKLIAMGSFQNAVHQTSGIAKIYADSVQKSYTLVLENFKTDADQI
jgi:hypothetical protein